MSEILWDKKTGSYEPVKSDYLTPEPHAICPEIELEIEVYQIPLDWGITITKVEDEVSGVQGSSRCPPEYLGTLKGICTDADFTIDSSTDMRNSCSLTMVVGNDNGILGQSISEFMNASSYSWKCKWLRIIKKYHYMNDVDMYPVFNWGDRFGLWNNNGIFRSDPSRHIIGWFVPNEGSVSYNADTKELSMSCIDIMSYLSDTRGGHLTYYWERPWVQLALTDKGDGKYESDHIKSPEYSSGLLLEGSADLNVQDRQFNNYLAGTPKNFV